MKRSILSILLTLLALDAGARSIRAGDDANAVENALDAAKPAAKDKRDKPDRPDKPDPKPGDSKAALNALKAEFRAKALDFQKKQALILEQLKHADREQRDQLREQLNELKENYKKDVRDEMKEKLSGLRPKLDKDTIDQAKEGGKPRGK